MTNRCPFKAGDSVRYQPTVRGRGLEAMGQRLTSGEIYTVEAVQDDTYVVVRGYTHPGGGIYWTEFKGE